MWTQIWTHLSDALTFVGVRGAPNRYVQTAQEHWREQGLPEKPGMPEEGLEPPTRGL
jgi:hypothetical protein